MTDADYSRSFGSDQLASLAGLYLNSYDTYYVGLLFSGLGATAGSYLWFKSNYIPKALAALGVVSSAWCAACTFVLYVFPNFPKFVNLWWFDSPMDVFELALSFWLLFKGLRVFRFAGSVVPGWSCQLNRSTQQLLVYWFGNASVRDSSVWRYWAKT